MTKVMHSRENDDEDGDNQDGNWQDGDKHEGAIGQAGAAWQGANVHGNRAGNGIHGDGNGENRSNKDGGRLQGWKRGGATGDMFWVVTYDIPATHDKWRFRTAKILFEHGLSRVQWSVFTGDATSNSMKTCMLRLFRMVTVNSVPSDIRFFPLCRGCHGKIMGFKTEQYVTGQPNQSGRSLVKP